MNLVARDRDRLAHRPRFAEGINDRGRSWLMAGIAFGCVGIYLCIWMTYAGIHTYSRYQQLPPGAVSTVDGVSYKVLKLTRTDVIVNGDETRASHAGATYVIAELEITTKKKDPACTIQLVADGKRTWESEADFFDRRLPQYCGDYDHPVTPGKPWRLEQIYLMPSKFADRLYGVAVADASSPAPIKVMTP